MNTGDAFAVGHERENGKNVAVRNTDLAEFAVDPDQAVVQADEVARNAIAKPANTFCPAQNLQRCNDFPPPSAMYSTSSASNAMTALRSRDPAAARNFLEGGRAIPSSPKSADARRAPAGARDGSSGGRPARTCR